MQFILNDEKHIRLFRLRFSMHKDLETEKKKKKDRRNIHFSFSYRVIENKMVQGT